MINSSGRYNFSLIVFVLLVVLATFCRFTMIDSQSLWYDEGNSARMTTRSFSEIAQASRNDVHPPGYYVVLNLWSRYLGTTEFGLRSISALLGVVCVCLIGVIVRKMYGDLAAIICFVLASLHPALVYYSQEARMYSLCVTMSVACVYFYIRIISEARIKSLVYAGYVICSVIGLYTHYVFALITFVVNFAFLLRMFINRIRNNVHVPIKAWFISHIIIFLCYLPWLSIGVNHLISWPATKALDPWTIWNILTTWKWLVLGQTVLLDDVYIGLVCYLFTVFIFVKSRKVDVIELWFLVPVLIILGSGLGTEAFEKFFIISVPAVVIAGGVGLAIMVNSHSYVFKVLGLIFCVIVISYKYLSLVNLYFNDKYSRDDYRTLVYDLEALNRDKDVVIVNAPNQMEVINYYDKGMVEFVPVANSRPLETTNEIRRLEMLADKYTRIKAVYWGDEQTDASGVIETWLNSNAFKYSETWYGQVRLIEFYVDDISDFEYLGVKMDNFILDSYGLNSKEFNPGEVVVVSLNWYTVDITSDMYKVFVHVSSSSNLPPVAQHDSYPMGGVMPTSSWSAGEMVLDRHGVYLPIDLQSGEYEVYTGMYSDDDGKRLSIDGKSEDEKILLSKIYVRSND